MPHNGSQFNDPTSLHTDPYEGLLKLNLEPRWTDQQLNRHILEAVRYGVAMERDRILSSTRHLTYGEEGVISEGSPNPGGAV